MGFKSRDGQNVKEAALLAFVSDVSGGDRAVMELVRAAIAQPPPATLEAMGFYPSGEESEFERVFRKTVSLLNDHKYLIAYEDKYVSEMLWDWINTGFIPATHLATETVECAKKLTDAIDAEEEELKEMADQFERVAIDFEAAAAHANIAIMSMQLGYAGDTIFAFTLPLKQAAKWRNVEFDNVQGESLGIRAFSWERYASFLTYALDADDAEVAEPTGKLADQPLRPIASVFRSSP